MNYLYDGTFEGLLTAVYEAYYTKQFPEKILSSENCQQDLFSEYITIQTDLEKFQKVYESIRSKISPEALMRAYYVYLSELKEAGTMVFNYLRFGWRVGSRVDLYLSDDRVLQVENLSRKVSGERHRMLGLLRFHRLQSGIFYAPIQPDYNITALLAPHFAERLSDQNWVIHDVKRKLAAFYDCTEGDWYISDFDTNQYALMKEDTLYQELWKQFFNAIAIKTRINPRLQKQHMPVRYWSYLIEKL